MVRERGSEPLPQQVTLGVPFRVSPDLEKAIRVLPDEVLVDRVPIQVEGLGEGAVRIAKNPILEHIESWQPARTPMGPVTLTHRIDNGLPEPVLAQWPVEIEVELEDLELQQIERVSCQIYIAGQTLVGVGDYDDTQIQNHGRATVTFRNWVPKAFGEVEPGEPGPIYCPPDAERLRQIDITLSLASQS